VLVPIAHTTHVVLAGAWFGGVVFTMLVVSPALGAMKWDEAERVGVRAVIGRRYALVGGLNLALLAVFALADGILGGFGQALYAEYALLPLLFGLVAAHGAFFGRRLATLAEAERGLLGGCRGGRVVRPEAAEPAEEEPEGVVGKPGGQRCGRRARREHLGDQTASKECGSVGSGTRRDRGFGREGEGG
jgi:hypothetical protein